MIEPHEITVTNPQVRVTMPDGQVRLASLPEFIVQTILVGARSEITVQGGLRVIATIETIR